MPSARQMIKIIRPDGLIYNKLTINSAIIVESILFFNFTNFGV
jgi:hypothetical protein